MSNISGNTFFIQNAVNCSDLGTINGNVSFLDTSSNCGQVLNAIFSGGTNCGQAYGCTIFCNSCSYGYVYGTGILRGGSVLYGAADCIILCDQSLIDPGASIVDCEFLVTTSVPSNCYSLNGCFYIYSSGSSTLAQGPWSNGYFCNGEQTNFYTLINGQPLFMAAEAQDASGVFIAYTNNGIPGGPNSYFHLGVAGGNYFNLSPGCTGNSLFPVGVGNIDGFTFFTMYISGSGCNILNGLYDLSDCYNNYTIMEIVNSCGLCCAGTSLDGFNLIKNSKALYGIDYYIRSDGGCFSTTFNCMTFSTGYAFYTSNKSYHTLVDNCCFVSFNVATGFNSLVACVADNNLYYVYNSGVATIATGLYSNLAICCGLVDQNFSTNMPTGTIDGVCAVYINGQGQNICQVFDILDDDYYYGLTIENNAYYDSNFPSISGCGCGCFEVKHYRSNCNTAALIVYDGAPPFPRVSINNIYTEGGAFFTYGDKSYKVCNAYEFSFDIQTNWSSSIPYDTITGRYFTYCSGIGYIPNGRYTNYAFLNSTGIDYSYTCLIPQQPLDDIELVNLHGCTPKYYIYTSGCAIGATGAYSNFYFTPNFTQDVAYTCIGSGAPQKSQDDTKYYEYFEGCAFLVTGCRNDVIGYDGSLSGTYNFGNAGEYNPVPCFTLILNGPYINTYYCNSVPNARVGIVTFDNLLVCCGYGLGDTGYMNVWLYCNYPNVEGACSSGFDPRSLGFSGPYLQRELCYQTGSGFCSYSEDSNGLCYSCFNCISICENGFVAIDNVFYSQLNLPAPICGYFDTCWVLNCTYICCCLYCNDYALCSYDLYCDIYDENNACIGQCCCGNCSYYYCCGQSVCGTCVACNWICVYRESVCIYLGTAQFYCCRAMYCDIGGYPSYPIYCCFDSACGIRGAMLACNKTCYIDLCA